MLDKLAGRITLRHACFLFAGVLYGVAGSPTPDGFGPAEIAIGLLLLIAIGPDAVRVLTGRSATGWAAAGQVFLLYGLSIPVMTGLFNGNAPGLILRDIIPFLFLLLPFFMQRWQQDSGQVREWVAGVVVFIGVAFALRVGLPFLLNGNGLAQQVDDMLYLSIAPTVVFAALYLAGMAGECAYRDPRVKGIVGAAALLVLSITAFSALVLTQQRASLGLAIVGLVFLLVIALTRRPVRMVLPLCIVAGLVWAYAPLLGAIMDSLWHKQELVGANMRLQEAAVVLDNVSASFWGVLFGKGWGATIASPAVGGVTVNFTHSLFTTYWLKTGICGVLVLVTYLGMLYVKLVPLLWRRPVLAVALAVPLVIDTVLYASFKSFDFGLILLLLSLCVTPGPRLRRAAP